MDASFMDDSAFICISDRSMQQLGAVDPRTDMATDRNTLQSQAQPESPPEYPNFKCIPEPLHHYLILLRYFPVRHSLVWATTHVQGLIMVEACISLTHMSNTDSVECRQRIQHTQSQI